MLKTTVIEPGFLEIGLDIITDFEHHEKDGAEWWYVYSFWEGYAGFAEDIRVRSEKIYLEGTVGDSEQIIKIEVPSLERVEEILPIFHRLMELKAEQYQKALQAAVLIKLGEVFICQ